MGFRGAGQGRAPVRWSEHRKERQVQNPEVEPHSWYLEEELRGCCGWSRVQEGEQEMRSETELEHRPGRSCRA